MEKKRSIYFMRIVWTEEKMIAGKLQTKRDGDEGWNYLRQSSSIIFMAWALKTFLCAFDENSQKLHLECIMFLKKVNLFFMHKFQIVSKRILVSSSTEQNKI